MTNYTPELYKFKSALPVWIPEREKEMNLWISLRTVLSGGKPVLRISGSSAYNIYVDGKFVAFGPARCAHGFYRVDEIDLSSYVSEKSVLAIDVAGYNINSFYHLDQPSFICAEVEDSSKTVCATGLYGFIARERTEHVEKVIRFSYQRTFCETYTLSESYESWYKDAVADTSRFYPVKLAETSSKKFIKRGSYLNTYFDIPAKDIYSYETFEINDHSDELRYPRQLLLIGNEQGYKGYTKDQFEFDNLLEARNIDVLNVRTVNEPVHDVELGAMNSVTYEMPNDTTGQIKIQVNCLENAEIIVCIDELMSDGGRVDFRRHGLVQNMIWKLEKGSYSLSTFEPYTFMYARIFVMSGKVRLKGLSVNYFGADSVTRQYAGNDPELKKIYDAAVETFRQNTFTIFMDCPSRERAGWLCDSFFTARSEKVLTGKSEIEHSFLENFLLPDKFSDCPEGMIPMCYPGDHPSGNYISNWAMFFVIELEEYYRRTGDSAFIEGARQRVSDLMKFFEKYENRDGLLEKLEKWVFVEWSKSNELVQDISFPTNMLYVKTLRAYASLYNDPEALKKADRLVKTINEKSFTDKGFYCDNAVYDESGKAVLSGEYTETCQYYAFFCEVATPETKPELWNRLLNDFGPSRTVKDDWPTFTKDAKFQFVYPSNVFIGYYLRLESMYRYGYHEKLKEDIKGYFARMAGRTGTLWEYDNPSASCNHGFASHVVYWMDGLGLIK